MRNFLLLVATAMITVSMIACHRAPAKDDVQEVEKDTLWYIDSVYMHRMGYNYAQGDSTFDRILVFKADENGHIDLFDEITDSVTIHEVYDYSFFPDSIIKRTYVDTIAEEGYYSVYELDERRCIVKLTQRIFDFEIVTEYKYDMEDHLAMIYFGSSESHCKWLWRDGNLESIVWGDGEEITYFLSHKDPAIPFESCYYELPKLDKALSMQGFYGQHPKNAIFVTAETENEEFYYSEAMYYDRGYPGVSVHQMCYQGIEYDSIEYSIHWGNVIR